MLILAGGVAVVATSTWAALQGRKALRVEWSKGPHASESTGSFWRQTGELLAGSGQVVRNDGDFDLALESAKQGSHGALPGSLRQPCTDGAAKLFCRRAK